MRALFGALIGLVIVWLTCSVFAWDINPGHWGGFLRFWGVMWAIPWGLGGAIVADK
jgi:hypothetical protein